MKKKALALMLAAVCVVTMCSGCSKGKTDDTEVKTPDNVLPTYYSDENEIPSDTYCIAHKEKNKNGDVQVLYYPLYAADSTAGDDFDDAEGYRPERYFWVNYNEDEGLIPTMYPGDKLIFKSSTTTPLKYSMEKFFDDGYTVGIAGLQENSACKYNFDTGDEDCRTMPYSNAKTIENVGDDVVMTFNKYGNTEIGSENVTDTGTISNLEEGKDYKFDVRIGTESHKITLKANIHLFVSAETYQMKDFDYITDQIVRINVPEYMTTGYYECNGAGVFRYLKEETDYKGLLPGDYNDTIYVYDDSGSSIKGSKDGLVLDDDGYLVTTSEQYEDENMENLDENGEHDYSPIDGDEDIDSYFRGDGADVNRGTGETEETTENIQNTEDATETTDGKTDTKEPSKEKEGKTKEKDKAKTKKTE